MEFGISTSFLRLDGRTILDYMRVFKQTGFELIEIDAHNQQAFPYTSPDFVYSLRREITTVGLTINSIHAPFHYSIADPEWDARNAGVHQIIQLLEGALPLVEMQERPIRIVIHPGHHLSRTPASRQARYCYESLASILETPAAGHYRICLENMLSSHYGARPDELVDLVHRLGEDRVSLCLDTSHAVYDSTPEIFLEDVFPYLATTHISDNYHQHEGEFHAIPMTLLHSRVDWPILFRRINRKLDCIIFELKLPPLLDNDILLEMTQLAIIQIRRFLF